MNPEELKFFAAAYANEELGKIDEERILHTDVSLRKTSKAAKAHRSGQYAQDAVNTAGQGGQLQGGQMLVNPQKFMLGGVVVNLAIESDGKEALGRRRINFVVSKLLHDN